MKVRVAFTPEACGRDRAELVCLAVEQQDTDLMRRLEAIYSDGGSRTPADRAALLVAAELESLRADAAFVATVSDDGTRIEVSRVTPYSEGPVHLAFPANAPYPLAEVLRRPAALFIESNEQLACDHPGLVRVEEADHACATIPLRDAEARVIGALNLGFEDPHAFGEAERVLIEAVAERCARELEQALTAT